MNAARRKNLDWSAARRLLAPGASVIVTTHHSIDGDAIGSELALADYLGQIGIAARIINQDPVPRIYRFLDEAGRARAFTETDRELVLEADVIFVVDVSALDRLGSPADAIRASRARRVCIDHHATNDGIGDVDLIDPAAAAAGVLVHQMIRALGGTVTPAMARSLFVAVATDTGWFRFPNASPGVFELAAELIRCGADQADIYGRIYEQLRRERLDLLGRGLATLRSAAGGRILWMVLTREMFEQTGADDEDVEGLVDFLRTIGGVEIALLFREAPDGKVRVSLRAKGDADVGRLAAQFGGGGHSRSAGIRTMGALADVAAKVVAAAVNILSAAEGKAPAHDRQGPRR